MFYRLLADLILLFHLAFILFVVLGGLLALRWSWIPKLHLPAVVWGVLIEFIGWTCPLTPLEQKLRTAHGGTTYQGGFIDQYLIPIIYPPGLTPELQWVLGGLVIVINLLVYSWVWWRRSHKSVAAGRVESEKKQPRHQGSPER